MFYSYHRRGFNTQIIHWLFTALSLAFLLCALLLQERSDAASTVDTPTEGSLYSYGPEGRYLLGGTWLFKLDTADEGLDQHFYKKTSTSGWDQVSVPSAWNTGNISEASMYGAVGWYRKDFKLPSSASALSWLVRFESVNYRATIWLNGKQIGKNTGVFLPFEFLLTGLKRKGTNRLVIRVDNRRRSWDFPPASTDSDGDPTGGWWNYGGILREVYLRKVNRVDLSQVTVSPELSCTTCSAEINYSVTAHNYANKAEKISLQSSYGTRKIKFGKATVGAGQDHQFTGTLKIKSPHLWAPDDPYLYNVKLTATAKGAKGGGKGTQTYSLKSGIRSIEIGSDGHFYLNGREMNIRGVGLHEDNQTDGGAVTAAEQEQLISWVKEVGATVIRSHYPLNPYMHELADKEGLLIWSEIPVYQVKSTYLKRDSVRKLATDELRQNILVNGNHPSVLLWSVGNELAAKATRVQKKYINQAVRTAKSLDSTRPVGAAFAAYPTSGCQKAYENLDVIGLNEYFGWYIGPSASIADREQLSSYLDSMHECYPKQAVIISEFGAEANRSGPVEEKGSYEFQQDFVDYHLGVYATKPWLAGALYWALQEFRVSPNWNGGNPRPSPPLHQKGVIDFNGVKKPAFTTLQNAFKATVQIASATQ